MTRLITISHDTHDEREVETFKLERVDKISRDGDLLTIEWDSGSLSDYDNASVEKLR